MTPFKKSVTETPYLKILQQFGMCSLEESVLTYETFLIRSESFPYHKIFLKHLKNLLKK